MTGPGSHNAAGMYLRLSEQPDDLLDYRTSRSRWALALLAAALLLLASLASVAGLAGGVLPLDKAVAASGPGKDGDGSDNSGPGSGDDESTNSDTLSGDSNSVSGTGESNTANTNSAATNGTTNTGTGGVATDNSVGAREGDDTADDPRGQTRTGRDRATGHETSAAKTDRPGLKTGASTRGETDRGDKTGKSERR